MEWPNQNTKQPLPLNCNPFSDCSTGKQAKDLAIATQVTDESTILIERPPCSPLAPPFSPIVSEETEHEEPIITICVPIQQVITHSHLPPAVSALFPANYTYVFEDFTQLDSHRVAFDTKFLVNVKTETEAKQWISKFEHITDTTYRITKGTKTIGKRICTKPYAIANIRGRRVTNLPKKTELKILLKGTKRQTVLLHLYFVFTIDQIPNPTSVYPIRVKFTSCGNITIQSTLHMLLLSSQ